MDYRKLLKKYIEHVGAQTGDNLIWETHGKTELFTNEEWEALNILDNELTEDFRNLRTDD